MVDVAFLWFATLLRTQHLQQQTTNHLHGIEKTVYNEVIQPEGGDSSIHGAAHWHLPPEKVLIEHLRKAISVLRCRKDRPLGRPACSRTIEKWLDRLRTYGVVKDRGWTGSMKWCNPDGTNDSLIISNTLQDQGQNLLSKEEVMRIHDKHKDDDGSRSGSSSRQQQSK